MRFNYVLASAALIVLACGCGGASEQTIAADRAKASQTWKLELDGSTSGLALQKMDVYLVDDEGFPEIFEIIGDGVTLVGTFPLDLHVGYEENYARLIGKPIPVQSTGGDPR